MCMLELFVDFLVTWEDSCSLTITAAVLVRSPEALLFVTSTPLYFLTRFPAFHGQEEGRVMDRILDPQMMEKLGQRWADKSEEAATRWPLWRVEAHTLQLQCCCSGHAQIFPRDHGCREPHL